LINFRTSAGLIAGVSWFTGKNVAKSKSLGQQEACHARSTEKHRRKKHLRDRPEFYASFWCAGREPRTGLVPPNRAGAASM
jgi:hypothetical protein